MDKNDNSKLLRETIRVLERNLGILADNKSTCCNVTLAQCHALVEIGRAGNIALNELALLLNLENSTMSRTVNNLVTKGLASRAVNSMDRRYITITLSESGRKLFDEVEDSMTQYFHKLYEAIPENKKEQVIESLQLLNDATAKLHNQI